MGHSGRKSEELVHKPDFACHAALCQAAMATADHPHHLNAFEGCVGGFHPLEATRRPDHALERAMTGLDDIVEIFRCPVLDIFRQQPFAL
jgi:hypothetical protein